MSAETAAAPDRARTAAARTTAPTARTTAPAVGAPTARLIRPRSYEEAVSAVRDCGPRGGIPRGRGRAYGDAARNAGGAVLDMTGLDQIHAVDVAGGTVLCDAGVSLRRLTAALLPLGWCVPVPPDARHTTVGGAIAADAYGANQHTAGSFARHVVSLELLTADGTIRSVRPGTPLFEATAGGLGLTGPILTATFRLRPVDTALMTVATERATDLDDLLARMTDGARRQPYEVARVDLLARGAATGRGVLTRADHAPLAALPARARRTASALGPVPPLRLPLSLPLPLPMGPAFVPEGPLSRRAAALLGEVRHRTAPRARTGELRSLAAFLASPDGLPYVRPYGGRGRVGSVAYRCVVGQGREAALRRIMGRLARHGRPATHAVLGRFGAGGPGWLSFPVPGWSLALDLPADLPGLGPLLDALDEEVAAAGGRVRLAGDTRLRPELLPAMYPRLDDFRTLRADLDPRGVFVSDLARRLAL
ncbi:FAD-binding oxidoreductase [Streptomyces sp. NPDC058417]|uniref:FAD-binding oxidoreductase n=1 Tax=unclassified Streptomyces TaxID=2593676 RepID=UPI0036698C81